MEKNPASKKKIKNQDNVKPILTKSGSKTGKKIDTSSSNQISCIHVGNSNPASLIKGKRSSIDCTKPAAKKEVIGLTKLNTVNIPKYLQ